MIYKYYKDLLNAYPSTQTDEKRMDIVAELQRRKIKLVVIDDDPTGIQTVHGCILLTQWKELILEKALQDESPLFYILSNSRSLESQTAEAINREIVRSVVHANSQYGFRLIFISRSDSTLRGHFPVETDAIIRELKEQREPVESRVFFAPAFIEAGRITAEDTHYMKTGDELIPVDQTEFASDHVFAYNHAFLPEYIVEKSNSNVSLEEIGSVSLKDLRNLSDHELQVQISSKSDYRYTIVNALEYSDLYRFSLALLRGMGSGSYSIVIRSSSSLPRALSGIPDRVLLTGMDLNVNGRKGIFIVGSHVQKTTRQLQTLLQNRGTESIETDVSRILDDAEGYFSSVLQKINRAFTAGHTPVIYTTRKVLQTQNKSVSLENSRKISKFLSDLVARLPFDPAYVVAKGGITSHDILVNGLQVTESSVGGQILPGVPVLFIPHKKSGKTLPYVIFPGNVGDDNALSDAYMKLQ